MSDQTPQPRAPMRRSLRVVLFASLAVNLIVLGLAAGAIFGNKKGGDRPPRDADFMGAYTRALPEDDRRAIGRAIRDHHRTSGITRETARRDFRQMLQLIRTSPFDAEAMKDKMTAQAQSAYERRETALMIWLDRVAAMSDAERQDYADQIEAQLKRMPKGKLKRPE